MNQNFSRNNNLLQISPQVLYEDNHLIAINKPAGLLVHGDVTGDVTAADWVKAYIKKKYNKPGEVFLGVAHRIDRPVSGVLLFARTSKALARINAAFQEHAVQKTYLAVTKKRPPATNGTLKNYLAKDHTANIVKIVPIKNIGAKEAVLEYTALQEANGFHLIKINPITGRPHQIRVQLRGMGCPIVGDLKYGFDAPLDDASILLHCYEMSLAHPVLKTPLRIRVKPPNAHAWQNFTYT